MKIAIVGTGYVGLITGTGLSSFGIDVTCVDIDKEKIRLLNSGELPIYEPQLKDLVQNNIKEGRLHFSSDLENVIRDNNVIFIAVGTPPKADGSTNLAGIQDVAKTIGKNLNSYKLIVNKSTVPIGTGRYVRKIIEKYSDGNYEVEVASNPEFLREGAAVRDFFHPNRIVLGTSSEKALSILTDLYRPLYLLETPFIKTNVETAELIKYAANSFLATKISFINEMANICSKTGANIVDVSEALGLDQRIGKKFLHAGIGFGGSCFPKDLRSLVKQADSLGYDFILGKGVVKVNENQRKYAFNKISDALKDDLKGKTIAILGASFKPETDDIRESPAIYLAKKLLKSQATVKIYDPKALNNVKAALPELICTSSSYEAAINADAVVLATEWNQFRHLDLHHLKSVMNGDLFFDFRNVYTRQEAENAKLKYFAIGK